MIHLAECKRGMAYRVHSRNLRVAVFDGRDGFIGIREKFGARFLFTEIHHEASKYHGTVKPIQEIVAAPDGIYLADGYPPGEGGNPVGSGVFMSNDALFHFLEPLDEGAKQINTEESV